MRKRFPKSSLIEGVGGTTHSGSLSGIACTDDKIATYLLSGKTPQRTRGQGHSDVKCEPVPQPAPGPANALTESASDSGRRHGHGKGHGKKRHGMPQDLRAQLQQAASSTR